VERKVKPFCKAKTAKSARLAKSAKNPPVCTVSGGGWVEVNATINNYTVWTVSGGGCEEKESPSARRRRPSWPSWTSWTRTSQCVPCQAAAGWRGKKAEVNATIKNYTVWTVSGGGCKEKESPPVRRRQPSRLSLPRTSQCEPCQAAAGWRGKKVEVNTTIKNYAVWTVSGGGCKEKESPPARQSQQSQPRTSQCEPCQAGGGWVERKERKH
jgi:hypothetical protein